MTEACVDCVVAGVTSQQITYGDTRLTFGGLQAPSHHLSLHPLLPHITGHTTGGRMLADAGNVNAVTSAKSGRTKNTI